MNPWLRDGARDEAAALADKSKANDAQCRQRTKHVHFSDVDGAYSFFATAPSVSCTMLRMKNQKDIESKGASNAPTSQSLSDSEAVPLHNAPVANATLDPGGIAPAPVKAARRKRARLFKSCDFDDERRRDLHSSFNNRISYLCKLAALVIAVITFGSVVLGQDNLRFVILGLCLSIALLAIALLQDSVQHRR